MANTILHPYKQLELSRFCSQEYSAASIGASISSPIGCAARAFLLWAFLISVPMKLMRGYQGEAHKCRHDCMYVSLCELLGVPTTCKRACDTLTVSLSTGSRREFSWRCTLCGGGRDIL